MDHQEARKEQLNALILELQTNLFEKEQQLIRYRHDSKDFKVAKKEIEHFKGMITKYQREFTILEEGKVSTQRDVESVSNYKEYFMDDFDDNSKGWWTGNTENIKGLIAGGFYYYDCKVEKGRVLWQKNEGELIPFDAGFNVEVSVQLTDGIENKAFGFMLGGDKQNYLEFALSGNGYYRLGQVFSDQWGTLHKFSYSTLINKKGRGSWNVIKIRKNEHQGLDFYINGTLVLTHDTFETFHEVNYWGFVAYDKMNLMLDYFRMYQD